MGIEDTTPVYRPFRAKVIYVHGKGFLSYANGRYCFSSSYLASILFYSDDSLDIALGQLNLKDRDDIEIKEAPDIFLVYMVKEGGFIQDFFKLTITPHPYMAARFAGEDIAKVRNMLDKINKDYRILHIT